MPTLPSQPKPAQAWLEMLTGADLGRLVTIEMPDGPLTGVLTHNCRYENVAHLYLKVDETHVEINADWHTPVTVHADTVKP